MKKGKAVFCVIVAVFLAMTLFSCRDREKDSSKDTPLRIAVLSDIHLMTEEEVVEATDEDYKDFTKKKYTAFHVSEAIYKSAIDNLIEQKPDVVLFAGDLSETGSQKSLQAVADGCKKLENAGISVFVTGGVSDFLFSGIGNNYSYKKNAEGIAEFAELFAGYGYNEAISRDTETLSYVADLDATHRLVVIDTASLYQYKREINVKGTDKAPEVSNALLCYIDDSLSEARDEGKEVFVMTYFPLSDKLLEDYGGISRWSVMAMDKEEEWMGIFTEYGVQYAVSGNTHAFMEYEYSDQNCSLRMYSSSALTGYPLKYRIFTGGEGEFGDQYAVSEQVLSCVREEYLPKYLTAEEKTAILQDPVAYVQSYAKKHIQESTQLVIDNKGVQNWQIKSYLERLEIITQEDMYADEAINDLCEDVFQSLKDLFDMPLYGENSLASVCAEYEIELPSVPYTTVRDFITETMCDVLSGEAINGFGTDEKTVVRYVVYAELKKLAELDIGGRLNEINDLVAAFDLTSIVDHVFTTGKLDITLDDTGLQLLTILEPYVQRIGKSMGIPTLSLTWLTDIKQILSIMQYLPNIMQGNKSYDTDSDTIYGVKYREYFDFENGIFKIEKCLDDVSLDIIAKVVLFSGGYRTR